MDPFQGQIHKEGAESSSLPPPPPPHTHTHTPPEWKLNFSGHTALWAYSWCKVKQLNVSEDRVKVYRPFPSSLVPLFQNGSKCETFHMKISSACSFILMQSKSLWNRHMGTRKWPIYKTIFTAKSCCYFENTRRKGGGGPPLNPPMPFIGIKIIKNGTKFETQALGALAYL